MLKHLVIGGKFNLTKHSTTIDSDLAVFETHITHHEGSVGGGIELEIAVQVGDDSVFGAFHHDGGTNEGQAILVNDLSTDLDGLRLCH